MNEFFFVGGAEVMDNDTSAKTRAARRLSIEPIHVGRIITSGAPSSPTLPPPVERIAPLGSPTTSTTFSHASYKPPPPSHTRSMSLADVARQGKRLSLNFPVQTGSSRSPTRSPPWEESPTRSPELLPSPTEGNFLTVLAAQERRVLELKEELHKAEQELEKLKKHWTAHEAMKKRNDLRRMQQLQPLNTNLINLESADDDMDGSSLWMQREMERRKAILHGVKSSQRKVFSGSRHTRTLSLLSPDKETYTPSFPHPADLPNPINKQTRPPLLPRSCTTPDMTTQVAENSNDKAQVTGVIPREVLVRTGKQMASDLKDGLWTFIEDLRQATVGDEGVNGTQSRTTQTLGGQNNAKRRSSKTSLTSGPRPAVSPRTSSNNLNQPNTQRTNTDLPASTDIGGSFWKEHGLDEPITTPRAKITKPSKSANTPQPAVADPDDTWDTWDTPTKSPFAPTTHSPSLSEDPLSQEVSEISTPRTSTSSTSDDADGTAADRARDAIPWPALTKLTPTNLKRTASHLMSEWERSLSPPVGEGREGASRSPSPLGGKKAD